MSFGDHVCELESIFSTDDLVADSLVVELFNGLLFLSATVCMIHEYGGGVVGGYN